MVSIVPALLTVLLACSGCGRFWYEELATNEHERDAGDMDAGRAEVDDAATDAAAGFDGSTQGPADAELDAAKGPLSDGSADAQTPQVDSSVVDAGEIWDPGCTLSVLWEADFSSDPTLLDANTDGSPDFVVRGGSAFPASELANGAWTSASIDRALDTNPRTNFTSRTLAEVRMRDPLGPSTPANGYAAAVFYINVGYTASDQGALFVSVVRTSTTAQQVWLYARDGTTQHRLLLGPVSAGTGFVHVELALEPSTDSVEMRVDGAATGSATFPRIPIDTDDRYATVIAATGQAQFDFVRVAHCKP